MFHETIQLLGLPRFKNSTEKNLLRDAAGSQNTLWTKLLEARGGILDPSGISLISVIQGDFPRKYGLEFTSHEKNTDYWNLSQGAHIGYERDIDREQGINPRVEQRQNKNIMSPIHFTWLRAAETKNVA